MQRHKPKISTWPKRNAVLITQSMHLASLIRELLRTFQWNLDCHVETPGEALDRIHSGNAYLCIVDDSDEQPVTSVVRHFMSDSMGSLTPILAFLAENHNFERQALSAITPMAYVAKPLTPAKFTPAIKTLFDQWEEKIFMALRAASYHWRRGKHDLSAQVCSRICEQDSGRGIAAQHVALHYRSLGKIVEAEKFLLQNLKKAPHDLGIMNGLWDLYINSSMPKVAIRLLEMALKKYGRSMTILPDMAQSALMLRDFNKALEILNELQGHGYKADQMTDFMTRIYFALGREYEAEQLMSERKGSFKKISRQWLTAEDKTFSYAS